MHDLDEKILIRSGVHVPVKSNEQIFHLIRKYCLYLFLSNICKFWGVYACVHFGHALLKNSQVWCLHNAKSLVLMKLCIIFTQKVRCYECYQFCYIFFVLHYGEHLAYECIIQQIYFQVYAKCICSHQFECILAMIKVQVKSKIILFLGTQATICDKTWVNTYIQ